MKKGIREKVETHTIITKNRHNNELGKTKNQ